MDLIRLNPVPRFVRLYESLHRTEECIARESRLIYMISGDISISINGKRPEHILPGELVYIPPYTPYRLRGKFMRAVIAAFDLLGGNEEYIPPSAARDGVLTDAPMPEHPFDKPIHMGDMECVADELLLMCESFISAEGEYLAEASARLKLVLLSVAERNDDSALPSRMVRALDAYIRENVGDEISNTEIGAIFGYHPFYVSNVLKAAKGQTLRQYIISYRLKLAKSLLETTDKGIADIAEECGFTDASYFTKSFKSSFGETPKEYRNRFKDEFI